MAHRKTKQHTVNVVKAQFCAPENISYLDLFEGFNPYNIIVDPDTGLFNNDFLPAKDTMLGLDSLFH